MDAPAETAEQHDWLTLPAGILQLIFCLASTWYTHGACLASLVCRTWRQAAAGCSSIRLLYQVGSADQSFTTWIGRNSQQLEALTLSGWHFSNIDAILTALAEAAAAARAAGRPLQLRTLRVLQKSIPLHITGQLLAALPHLRRLQLGISLPDIMLSSDKWGNQIQQYLAPLQSATQLEELHLTDSSLYFHVGVIPMAALLPPSLRRLSWSYGTQAPSTQDLSHLTKLTFLRLVGGRVQDSSRLPPRLQQLELVIVKMDLEVLEEQKEALTAWDTFRLRDTHVQQLLPCFTNMAAAVVKASDLCDPAAQAALAQCKKLSTLAVETESWIHEPWAESMPAVVTTAASLRGLRRLHLTLSHLPDPPAGFAALTQLTHLKVSVSWRTGSEEQRQRQRAWVAEVGHMAGLRWLSVPGVLLAADQAWLGGLQQLRVLAVRCKEEDVPHVSSMSWLGALPPRLQVLGVSGMTAEQAADWQLRRRLQQALGSSGCEVVVGPDLDELADPTQQLAGLPMALQQALVCQV
jgi:hypothetical protein